MPTCRSALAALCALAFLACSVSSTRGLDPVGGPDLAQGGDGVSGDGDGGGSPDLDGALDLACPAMPLQCAPHCPTLSDVLASIRAGNCYHGVTELTESGTCGTLTYAQYSVHGLDVVIDYFDRAGAMVASSYCSDTNEFCGGTSFCQTWGYSPDCQRVRTDGGALHCGVGDGGVRG
jgi:hypothetical protein